MKVINSTNEYGNLLCQEKKPIIVDFYANWCQPCKNLLPFLENMEINNKEINFDKIDIENENCSDIIQLYEIKSLPTIIFVNDKLEVDELRIIGYNTEELTKNIDNLKKLIN